MFPSSAGAHGSVKDRKIVGQRQVVTADQIPEEIRKNNVFVHSAPCIERTSPLADAWLVSSKTPAKPTVRGTFVSGLALVPDELRNVYQLRGSGVLSAHQAIAAATSGPMMLFPAPSSTREEGPRVVLSECTGAVVTSGAEGISIDNATALLASSHCCAGGDASWLRLLVDDGREPKTQVPLSPFWMRGGVNVLSGYGGALARVECRLPTRGGFVANWCGDSPWDSLNAFENHGDAATKTTVGVLRQLPMPCIASISVCLRAVLRVIAEFRDRCSKQVCEALSLCVHLSVATTNTFVIEGGLVTSAEWFHSVVLAALGEATVRPLHAPIDVRWQRIALRVGFSTGPALLLRAVWHERLDIPYPSPTSTAWEASVPPSGLLGLGLVLPPNACVVAKGRFSNATAVVSPQVGHGLRRAHLNNKPLAPLPLLVWSFAVPHAEPSAVFKADGRMRWTYAKTAEVTGEQAKKKSKTKNAAPSSARPGALELKASADTSKHEIVLEAALVPPNGSRTVVRSCHLRLCGQELDYATVALLDGLLALRGEDDIPGLRQVMETLLLLPVVPSSSSIAPNSAVAVRSDM